MRGRSNARYECFPSVANFVALLESLLGMPLVPPSREVMQPIWDSCPVSWQQHETAVGAAVLALRTSKEQQGAQPVEAGEYLRIVFKEKVHCTANALYVTLHISYLRIVFKEVHCSVFIPFVPCSLCNFALYTLSLKQVHCYTAARTTLSEEADWIVTLRNQWLEYWRRRAMPPPTMQAAAALLL